MSTLISNILYSKSKHCLKCPEKTIKGAVNFGFSYIEHEDHIVQYIVANKRVMKKILAIEDSIIEPNKIFLGELWTAKLILSNKLNDSQIIFSNSEFSIVIDIDLNPEEKMYA